MAGMKIVKSLAVIAAVGLFAEGLAACRPMYASSTISGDSVSSEMAAIQIDQLPGRVGQKIRNELIFQFTGGGNPESAKYKLEIVYRESLQGVLYKRTDDASGKVYSLDVSFTLKSIDGKTEFYKGRSHARAAYDKHTSTFSNVRAELDAQNRAARDIAKDINTQLAARVSSYN